MFSGKLLVLYLIPVYSLHLVFPEVCVVTSSVQAAVLVSALQCLQALSLSHGKARGEIATEQEKGPKSGTLQEMVNQAQGRGCHCNKSLFSGLGKHTSHMVFESSCLHLTSPDRRIVSVGCVSKEKEEKCEKEKGLFKPARGWRSQLTVQRELG